MFKNIDPEQLTYLNVTTKDIPITYDTDNFPFKLQVQSTK